MHNQMVGRYGTVDKEMARKFNAFIKRVSAGSKLDTVQLASLCGVTRQMIYCVTNHPEKSNNMLLQKETILDFLSECVKETEKSIALFYGFNWERWIENKEYFSFLNVGEPLPYERVCVKGVRKPCVACGSKNIYAKGLCKPCYLIRLTMNWSTEKVCEYVSCCRDGSFWPDLKGMVKGVTFNKIEFIDNLLLENPGLPRSSLVHIFNYSFRFRSNGAKRFNSAGVVENLDREKFYGMFKQVIQNAERSVEVFNAQKPYWENLPESEYLLKSS